ncbi:MAG: RNA polymerase sigma factor [Anaerolineae bacterium]|nr:RNA polymerase sigma factor [Anaerolineae bacterium]
MTVSEQDAISKLKAGEISGLETLVRLHQVRALRTAYLILRDRAAAEDVVQDCFLSLIDSIGSFDQARPFAPYFLRGVINRAVKQAQRDQRSVAMDEAHERLPAPAEALDAAETKDQLWTALGQLSPEQRAAVVQHYFLDMSEAEIAKQADAPQGTIKWRLHAARKRLRELLRPFRHETGRG